MDGHDDQRGRSVDRDRGRHERVTASFNTNSNGDDIDDQGIADDVEAQFWTTLGTVDPDTDCTCFGLAFTDLTSGDVPGTATVSGTVDSETVSTDVVFAGSQATIAPAPFDFGSVQFGAYSPLQKFTVKNTGNADLVVSSVSIGRGPR